MNDRDSNAGSKSPPPAGAGGRFPSTCWTMVLAAGLGSGGTPQSRQSLAALCEAYWYPLYLYLRRRGHDPAAAEDLTQGFLTRLLEKNGLAAARPDRGRFRTFLLASLNHYAANEWRKERAAKRGGAGRGVALGPGGVRVDPAEAEQCYRREPALGLTPEQEYDRRWALTLLGRALEDLRRRYAAEGKAALFERLEGVLAGDGAAPHAEIATDLGLSAGAVKVAAHRLRRRYREGLRGLIAQTVESEDQIEDEIRSLFLALRP